MNTSVDKVVQYDVDQEPNINLIDNNDILGWTRPLLLCYPIGIMNTRETHKHLHHLHVNFS